MKMTSWSLNQPLWTIWFKMGIFPKFRGENKTYLSCHQPVMLCSMYSMSTINAQQNHGVLPLSPSNLPWLPAASWSCITFKRSKAIPQCRESSRALKVLLQPTAFAPKWPRFTTSLANFDVCTVRVCDNFFWALTKEIRKKSEKFRVKKSKLVLETITQTSRFFLVVTHLENPAPCVFFHPSQPTHMWT